MEITAGLSEIAGAIIGDGWIQSKRDSIFISGHKTEDRLYYANYLAPLFSKEFKLDVQPREFSYWRTFGISIHRKFVIKSLLDVGLPRGEKAKTVRIPRIFKDDTKLGAHLLRGIFDTDGNIYFGKYNSPWRKGVLHDVPRLSITSISKGLIEDIKDIADKLGIKYANPKPSPIRGNRSPCFKFEVNRISSLEKWNKLIGTSNPKHKTKFEIWKRFGFCPSKTSLEERIKILKGDINPNIYYAGVE